MNKIACLLSLFAAILASSSLGAVERPNVLLILADDLGYSDLGCYGSEIHTPHLDELAAGGLRFTQFYNTARCWPSRAALLTGYYAQQVRRDVLPGVKVGRRPEWAPLLSQMLEAQGYRSYHSGKWHVDGMPLEGGFDRSYYLGDQGRFFHPKVHYDDDQPLPPVAPDSGYYATIAIADHAIRCLREHAAKYADRPFFHYLAFTAPHFPLHALPEDIARYQDEYTAGWDAIRQQRWERMREMDLVEGTLSAIERDVGPPYHYPEALATLGPGEVNRPVPWSELTDQQRRYQATKMAIHAAMIDRMDREIGRVLEQLRAMNAFENTLILFLSDNGASAEIMVRDDGHDPQAPPGSAATHLCLGPGWSTSSNTPFRRHKTWVHEGGIATPFIAHWPQGIDAHGELRKSAGHVIDVVPTILEIAGAKQPVHESSRSTPALPGLSLLPVFESDQRDAHEFLWWSHEGHRALRVGDWKLVAAKGDPWELYNLAQDPTETTDLAAQHPQRVAEMEQIWTAQQDKFLATLADEKR
jgi:arylsulfatase